MKCPVCGRENKDDSHFCGGCGANLTGATLTGRLAPQTMLDGRYVVLRTLGQGGMGAVYLATDTRLNNKPVAIKEMSTRAVGGDLRAAIDSFQKEAQMLISLRHPALPVIYDFFSREESRWYLVMDYIQGDTLKAEMQKRGRIPEPVASDWAVQICDILEYLHKRNPPVIFRDLKPDNIMLTPEGRIKLIDFGIARNFQPGNTADTAAYGSGGFSPPEQYGQKQTDARSDIYALGATLHYLLTGIDPSPNPFRFEPPGKYTPVSAGFEKAIMQALDLNPENRPQSIGEFKSLISESLSGFTASLSPVNASVSGEKTADFMQESNTVPLTMDHNQVRLTPPAGAAVGPVRPNAPVYMVEPRTAGNALNGPLVSLDTSPAHVPKPKSGKKAQIIIGALLAIVLAAGGFWGWLGYSSEARVQAKLELAIKHLSENDYEKAILEFNEAIKIDPRNIEARVGLAQAYIGIGDTQKADEVLTTAMSIGTLSPGQYQQVIEMYIKKGNYNEAAKLLAQARVQYPDNEALKAIDTELVQKLMGFNVSNSNMQINTLLKENPRSVPEGIFASLNPRSTKLRFYRSTVARKSTEISEDEYTTRFDKSAPSNIYFQLYSDITPPEHEVFYEIKSILYKSDGSILDRGTVYCNVERNWQRSSISLNDYNDSKGGYWEVGSYKVEAFIDGNLVATGSFEVY